MKYLNNFGDYIFESAPRKYSDDELKDIASKYKTKTEFQSSDRDAYQASLRRSKDFYNSITSHMINEPIRVTNIKYSDEELEEAAKKYNTIGEFIKGDFHKYHASQKRGKDFFNKITSHMSKVYREPYTLEELKNIAKKYKTRSEFQLSDDSSAYQVAYGRDDFEDIVSHMPMPKRYTEDEIRETAKKYKLLKDFAKDPAYFAAYRKGKNFYNDITRHMRTKWNEEDLKHEIMRWNTIDEIIENMPGLYHFLMKHPILYHKYLDEMPQS